VANLHVNFTIVVYSPTNITSLFYPISKFSCFCICDTPLNCYYFTHQSHPFAHLTSFAELQNSLSKTRLICNSYFRYRRYVVQLCIAYLYWNRLSTIKHFYKNRMHRILKLELEQTNNDCALCNVLTKSQLPSRKRGIAPNFQPMSVVAKDATWY